VCGGEGYAGEVWTEGEGEEGGEVVWDYGVEDSGEDEGLGNYERCGGGFGGRLTGR